MQQAAGTYENSVINISPDKRATLSLMSVSISSEPGRSILLTIKAIGLSK